MELLEQKIRNQRIVVSEKFITNILLPCFEQGLKKKQERAFALIGSNSGNSIRIEDWIKIPKDKCYRDKFEPIETERKILGYIHSHPVLLEDEYLFGKTWLSEGDINQMKEGNELIRGICVLPINDPIINAVIVFWRDNYPKPLPMKIGNTNSDYASYLHKNKKNKWRLLEVQKSSS